MDEDNGRSGFDTGSADGDMDDFLTNMDAFDATGPDTDVFGLDDDESDRIKDQSEVSKQSPALEIKREEDKSEPEDMKQEPKPSLSSAGPLPDASVPASGAQSITTGASSPAKYRENVNGQRSDGHAMEVDGEGDQSNREPSATDDKTGATATTTVPAQAPASVSAPAPIPAATAPQMAPQTTVTVIPSYASWFSMDRINEIEKKSLPEFFNGRNQSKTPKTYVGYRDFMISTYRLNPLEYLSVTACRRHLVGDVGTIMRVHQFLDRWGLINYEVLAEARPIGVAPPYTGHWKTTLDTPRGLFPFQFYKGVEDPAAAVEDQSDLQVNGGRTGETTPNTTGGAGVSLKAEESKKGNIGATITQRPGWSKDETLRLLNAVERNPNNWQAIASAVGRSREECLTRFITLCSEDRFLDNSVNDRNGTAKDTAGPLKYAINNIPFSQADNPVTSVVGFLASLVDARVVMAAAGRGIEELKRQADSSKESDEPSASGLATSALASMAARSHVLSTHSERQMYGQFVNVVGQQVTKMELKLERFAAIERALEAERRELEREREEVFLSRVAIHRKAHAVEGILRRALDEAKSGDETSAVASLEEAQRTLADNTRLAAVPAAGPDDSGNGDATKSYDTLKPISSEMPTTHKFWSA
jgi:hypothetical protein